MHQTLSDKDLQEYYRTSLLPAGIRPNGCTRANCLEKLHFHHHSSYSRNSVYRQGYGWLPIIWIERFRCASCRKVISLLIPTVYKWQRAEHDLQQAVALKQPYPKEEVTEAFSERTLLRWKQKWQEWCGLHLQAICTWLFTLYELLAGVACATAREIAGCGGSRQCLPLWRRTTPINTTLFVTGLCRKGLLLFLVRGASSKSRN